MALHKNIERVLVSSMPRAYFQEEVIKFEELKDVYNFLSLQGSKSEIGLAQELWDLCE